MTRQHSQCATCGKRYQQALWPLAPTNRCNACLARLTTHSEREFNAHCADEGAKHRALKATEGK